MYRLLCDSKTMHLRIGAARSVQSAFGIETKRPEIGKIRIGEWTEAWRRHQLSVAANRHALRRAFLEFAGFRLTPGARVLGSSPNCGNRVQSGSQHAHPNRSPYHQNNISFCPEIT